MASMSIRFNCTWSIALVRAGSDRSMMGLPRPLKLLRLPDGPTREPSQNSALRSHQLLVHSSRVVWRSGIHCRQGTRGQRRCQTQLGGRRKSRPDPIPLPTRPRHLTPPMKMPLPAPSSEHTRWSTSSKNMYLLSPVDAIRETTQASEANSSLRCQTIPKLHRNTLSRGLRANATWCQLRGPRLTCQPTD